jgi:hypothetical protein
MAIFFSLSEVVSLRDNRNWRRHVAATQFRRIDIMGRGPWQFETVEERNYWTPSEKATYLIPALNEPAARILHGVPTGATHRRGLRIATVTTNWKQRATPS